MDDKPLVSIIVLTYKDYSKLDDLLNSCFMQDYDNFEVIVRDDGSPNYDKELFMLKFENCPKKVNYEIVHDEKNKGTVINFNEAIKISKGKYIVVIAGDDTFRGNNVISRIVSKFEKENVMCVSARERHFWNDGREIILPSIYEESIIKRNLNRKLWYMISAHPCFIVGSATSYRRDVFEKYGFFNEKYKLLEDWPFYLKLLENGEKIAFLDCETINHYSGGVSSSSECGRNKFLIEDDIRCIEYVWTMKEKMKLSRWECLCIEYRKFMLYNELNFRDKKEDEKKFAIVSKVDWLWNKIRNLTLRIDIRKVQER